MRKAMHIMGVLDDRDIDWIAANGSVRRVANGECLVRAGKPVEFLFFLLEGSLAVEAGAHHVATLQVGEVVGEISFVDSRPPLADVIARQDSRVLALPARELRRKLDEDVAFASRFFRAVAAFLANRLRLTTGRLGYGQGVQDEQPDEMDIEMLDTAGLGATRFDKFLSRLLHGR